MDYYSFIHVIITIYLQLSTVQLQMKYADPLIQKVYVIPSETTNQPTKNHNTHTHTHAPFTQVYTNDRTQDIYLLQGLKQCNSKSDINNVASYKSDIINVATDDCNV